jgi:hypothetical protein
MKSTASLRIERKMSKLRKAFTAFVRAILAHPRVEKTFSIALISYLVLGFIGLAWGVISLFALLISGFKSGGIADWLRDFIKDCPWLALIWLLITVSSCLMFLYNSKTTTQSDQA